MARRGKNGAGKCLKEPCWRLSETGLSWADTRLITQGQVMIWGLKMKIKLKNLLLGHYGRVKDFYNFMHLPVVAQCHIAAWAEAVNMHGVVDCEMIHHEIVTPTLYFVSPLHSLYSDMTALTSAQDELKRIEVTYQKVKNLHHKYFIGWRDSWRWQAWSPSLNTNG